MEAAVRHPDSLSGTSIAESDSQGDLALCTSVNSAMGLTYKRTGNPKQGLLPIHNRHVEPLVREPYRRVLTTPKFLQNFLGFLCLVYLHGEHRRPCRCLRLCDCTTTKSLSMTFQLPHWLLSYALTVLYTVSNRVGPEFLLRTPRVRPANSDVFHFACTGNIEGMRSLFRHGLATPFDIEYGTGLTALHVSSRVLALPRLHDAARLTQAFQKAVDWRQFDVIDLLRAEGADPFQGDYQGW